MFLIVGLGNPEEKYRRTYHNLGFVAAEDAAIELGLSFKHKKCRALVAEGFFKGEKIVVAKPQGDFPDGQIGVTQQILGRRYLF